LLLAPAMESLVEIILVISAVIVAFALLPLGTEGRVFLGSLGLGLAAVGTALFGVVAYPRQTLLLLGTCSAITGAGWGYAQVTAWLARRGTRRWTARVGRSRRRAVGVTSGAGGHHAVRVAGADEAAVAMGRRGPKGK
jgi:hypothetical protein